MSWFAHCSHMMCFSLMVAPEPPRTVKSSPPTTTDARAARAKTKLEGSRCSRPLRRHSSPARQWRRARYSNVVRYRTPAVQLPVEASVQSRPEPLAGILNCRDEFLPPRIEISGPYAPLAVLPSAGRGCGKPEVGRIRIISCADKVAAVRFEIFVREKCRHINAFLQKLIDLVPEFRTWTLSRDPK